MFVGKMKKTVERPTNKLYPEEYFNKFIILTEDENIRYRPGTQAAILADIKGKFSNWHYWLTLIYDMFCYFRDISNRGEVLNFPYISDLTLVVM